MLAATERSAEAFGVSVALAADVALVGSADEQAPSPDGAMHVGGRAYVFAPAEDGTWRQTQELVSPDPGPVTAFGDAVAAAGDRIAVGGPATHVELFVRDHAGSPYVPGLRIAPPDASARFGASVALSAGFLAIGAPDGDSVYLYTSAGEPLGAPKLVGDKGSRFGARVCFANDTLVVGAFVSAGPDTTGSVHTFAQGPTGWTETSKTAEVPLALACAGDRIAIAGSSDGSSEAVVVARDGNGWKTEATFASLVPRFGGAIGVFPSALAVGVPVSGSTFDTEPAGIVEIYRRARSNSAVCATSTDCQSGECADGVCCDRACGADPNDCQACSVAAGAHQDGVCEPLAAVTVCRGAKSECNVADHCDGTSAMCPADDVASNGTACTGGTCSTGMCVAPSGEPVPPPPLTPTPEAAPAPAPAQAGCAASPGPGSSPAFALLLAVLVLVIAVVRGQRRRSARIAGVTLGLLFGFGARRAEAAPAWQAADALTAPGSAVNDQFGASVALQGNRAVVGAPGLAEAFVLERSGDQWMTVATLVGHDLLSGPFQPEEYGIAVALDGDTAVVGASYKQTRRSDTSVDLRGGWVYVFVRGPDGAWTETQSFGASDTQGEDRFGTSLALRGDVLVVGAKDQPDIGRGDTGVPTNSGAAYVFRRSGGRFLEEQKLVAIERRAGDSFGRSVAVGDDVVLVGASEERARESPGTPRATHTGSVYAFDRIGGSWNGGTRLVAPAAVDDARLGASVALADDRFVAGAPGLPQTGATGYATVFRRLGTAWTFEQRLDAGDLATANDGFGTAVGMSGATTIVGRPRFDDPGGASAHVFARTDASWSEVASFTARPPGFGRAVACSDGAAAIGDALLFVESGTALAGTTTMLRYGARPGEACGTENDCQSGFCVDGVCCDSACGGGNANDCQVCSVAAGGAADGTCGPRKAKAKCRPRVDTCDVTDTCDGLSLGCPADVLLPNGTTCNDTGTCTAGVCSVAGLPPEPDSAAPSTADMTGGCHGARGPADAGAGSLALAGLVAVACARRKRERGRR